MGEGSGWVTKWGRSRGEDSGEFIVVSGSLLGPVSLLDRGHCVVSLLRPVHCCVGFIAGSGFIGGPVIVGTRLFLGRVHCCMGFIVGFGFIVRPGSMLVLVN